MPFLGLEETINFISFIEVIRLIASPLNNSKNCDIHYKYNMKFVGELSSKCVSVNCLQNVCR